MDNYTSKVSTTIKVLTRKDFENNEDFYQNSLNQISLSLGINLNKDWNYFFERHPINSIVLLNECLKIVSFIYATPHRDYVCYSDTDLKHWGINYIQTHKDYQRRGYAKRVLLYCLKDILQKGAIKLDALPNSMSLPLFNQIVEEYKLPSIERDCRGVITLLEINKIKQQKFK